MAKRKTKKGSGKQPELTPEQRESIRRRKRDAQKTLRTKWDQEREERRLAPVKPTRKRPRAVTVQELMQPGVPTRSSKRGRGTAGR